MSSPRVLSVLLLVVVCASVGRAEVVIETVTVGNPGNFGEESGESVPDGYGPDRVCGSVDYVFDIGKFEVTAGQYCEFLNAVAATDTYGLYHEDMADPSTEEVWGCNIQRSGSPGSYSYTIAPDWADRPVNYVSWGDAARFCNWLQNGQPTGPQDLSTTEDGSYYVNGETMDVELLAVVREPDAHFVIPTEDEWYKAAYYDGGSGAYYNYPTGTDDVPSNELVDPDPGNNANFATLGLVYALGPPYYRSESGDFENSESPYGTFDQGGNVYEWNEAILFGTRRGFRGGAFHGYDRYMLAAHRKSGDPTFEHYNNGFRVANVPEALPRTWCPVISYPEPLNTNAVDDTGEDDHSQIAADGQGTWIVVWESNDRLDWTVGDDWDILFSRSTDDGMTWSAPVPVHATAMTDDASDKQPTVSTDGLGNWVVAWRSANSLGGMIDSDWDILFTRSSDNGATWSHPVALNSNAVGDDSGDYDVQLAADGQGTWLATWFSEDDLGGTIGSDQDILLSRSADDGQTWSAALPLDVGAGTDNREDAYPHVATDSSGRWIVAWQSRNLSGDPLGTDQDILVAQSSDNGASWSTPAPLNTNAATDTGTDSNVVLIADGVGHWVAVWDSNDDLDGTIGSDRDILFARSSDDGNTWTAPAALNSNAGSSQSYGDSDPSLTTNEHGAWIAVWGSYDLRDTTGEDTEILVSYSLDNGETWSASQVLNSNAFGDEGTDEDSHVASDRDGRWIAVWSSHEDFEERLGSDGDILIAHVYPADEDCNGNSVMDGCDIADGTSDDCNFDYVPDECQPDEDCNTNAVRDICDIGEGTSLDCNANLVPDECDIAAGTSPDCDSGGVPDECEAGYGSFGWVGPGDGSFEELANWDPAGVPGVGGDAVLSNVTEVDNRSILSGSGSREICTLAIGATSAGRQFLRIENFAELVVHNTTTISAGGEIELQGTVLEGGVVINAGGSVSGSGEVSADFVNQGEISGAAGGMLLFSGSIFQNQASGLVGAPFGSLVYVASTEVTQGGQLEINTQAGVLFDAALTNLAGGTVTILGGSLGAPSLTNDPSALIYGFGTVDSDATNGGEMTFVADTEIVGDLVNNGLVTIQSGLLTILGSLTGSGTIVGDFFGRSGNDGLTVLGDYQAAAPGSLQVANGTLKLVGDFDVAINDPARLNITAGTLQLVGLPEDDPQLIEVLAEDVGACVVLPDPSLFSFGGIRIGPTATTVQLVDDHDNAAGAGAEAVYVEQLVLDEGTTLDLAGSHVYYVTVTPEDPYAPDSGVTVIDSAGGGALIPVMTIESPAAEAVATPKNRYLSFQPNNAGEPVAFHVELTASDYFPGSVGFDGWVGEPDADDICRLAAEAYYSSAWPATVHVGDCHVVPAATYEVSATCNGEILTDPLTVTTIPQPGVKYWADVVGDFGGAAWTEPQGTVNMSDIMAVLQCFSSTSSAPPLTWCDLDGQTPNAIVNMTDVQQAVAGFKGEPYPFPAPADCP